MPFGFVRQLSARRAADWGRTIVSGVFDFRVLVSVFGVLGTILVTTTATGNQGIYYVAGLLALIMVMWRPLTFMSLVVVLCQEVNPKFGQFGLTVLGYQVYFTEFSSLPLVFYLALIAFLATYVKQVGRAVTGNMRKRYGPLIVVSIFALAAGAIALIQNVSFLSVFGQVIKPLVIFGFAWGVGSHSYSEVERKSYTRILGLVMILLAVLGLPVALTGGGHSLGGQLVYYDTATAALAAAMLLSVLRQAKHSVGSVAVAVASAVVLVVSFRRSVVVALLLTVLIGGLMSPTFRKVLLRGLTAAVALVLLGTFTIGKLLLTFWDRIVLSFNTLGGDGVDQSTSGHVDDIVVGFNYAVASPFGYGPLSRPLPGLFTQGQALYVHNEILLNWLRFGVVGLVLTVVILICFVSYSWRVMFVRQRIVDISRYGAASFVLIYIVASMTAPFMMTTSRWPVLLGLAVGILSVCPRPVVSQQLDLGRSAGENTWLLTPTGNRVKNAN